MPPPGFESGFHVFTALIAMLIISFLIAIIYVWPYAGRSIGVQKVRILSILVAILVWLTWIAVTPLYTREYGVDRQAILKYSNIH